MLERLRDMRHECAYDLGESRGLFRCSIRYVVFGYLHSVFCAPQDETRPFRLANCEHVGGFFVHIYLAVTALYGHYSRRGRPDCRIYYLHRLCYSVVLAASILDQVPFPGGATSRRSDGRTRPKMTLPLYSVVRRR